MLRTRTSTSPVCSAVKRSLAVSATNLTLFASLKIAAAMARQRSTSRPVQLPWASGRPKPGNCPLAPQLSEPRCLTVSSVAAFAAPANTVPPSASTARRRTPHGQIASWRTSGPVILKPHPLRARDRAALQIEPECLAMPAAAPARLLRRRCGHSHPFRFTPLSRDRLAIEVKGLTAVPVAAVNGADFTREEQPRAKCHARHRRGTPHDRQTAAAKAPATIRSRRGSPMPAATRPRITAMSTPRSTTPRPCSTRAPRTTSPIAAAINTVGAARRPRKRFQNALKDIEGPQCEGVALLPSGLAAISTALLSVLRAGDHVLVTDSAYFPTRKLCDTILARYGIATTYYDPTVGSGHRGAAAAQHPRRVRREPGLADLRDPGYSGHRRRGARAQCRGRDGQYLGEPALFPCPGKGRRPLDPVRHQIYRRAFRPHARARRRQHGDLAG